ncbi:response regulator [Kribbella sp. NPDC050124]|uniref:response regulator n=1 Tax=Kribbella sp. NPDC050124 TaxID=3364114 RepID=UPI0037ABF22E
MELRCYIVDDSIHFLDAAQTLLERDGVSVVGVASTIEQALREVDDAEPDVVLVDVNLGSESGLELARRMPRETGVDRSRVILISADADDDVAELVQEVPVAAYLPKAGLSAAAVRRVLNATVEG